MAQLVKTLSDLKKNIFSLRKCGKKIVFTNGCFDLIHPGHIKVFRESKKRGDVLVLGLNSDSSIRKIKGEGRPILNEKSRVDILKSIVYIDFIILFDEKTPLRIIKAIKPDVLVKGGDWRIDKIVGGDFVRSYGGEVFQVKLQRGFSTTGIIKKILSIYGKGR